MKVKILKRLMFRKALIKAEEKAYSNLVERVLRGCPKSYRGALGNYMLFGKRRLLLGREQYGPFFPGKKKSLPDELCQELGDIPVYANFIIQEFGEGGHDILLEDEIEWLVEGVRDCGLFYDRVKILEYEIFKRMRRTGEDISES